MEPDMKNIMNPKSVRGSDKENPFAKNVMIVKRPAMISGI
jgi:hypothetical protein